MQTIVLYLCYIVLILLFSTAYNTSLIYCFVIWCLHTNKRKPCSSTLSGHPSSSLFFDLFFHLFCEYTDVAPCVRAYVFVCVHVTFTIPTPVLAVDWKRASRRVLRLYIISIVRTLANPPKLSKSHF